MVKNKINQNGFSAVVVALIAVVIGIIGFTGWYVYNAVQKNTKEDTSNSTTSGQSNSKSTPTPTKIDETASWKAYRNTKYAFFSFKYPSVAELDDNVQNAPYYLGVTVSPIDKIEDFTMGWTKQNFRVDLAAIKKGNPATKFGMTEDASYKIVNIQKGYGKKYTSLSGLDYCGATFSRSANIYIEDTLVHISYSAGSDKQKIMAANPTFYTKNADCGADGYVTKNYEEFAKFYTELEKGNTDSVSQTWFTDFDKIIGTFKFE